VKIEDVKNTAAKPAKWAALIGVLLALACHMAPQDYRAVCQALVSVCTGGGK
jgi:hypothetical protein